ncbi:hypothetical protein FA13DRAFT_725341 [Coprinellus micaceus]|uniref:Uncharacterized protein n=1 Tax=Coprinellus micaceus TaxID=71717 RepID=A0A4Y7TVD7_COPMI|nr:hypothetical protein FA13DRAFT_725341 [Coprinellus micaceus]
MSVRWGSKLVNRKEWWQTPLGTPSWTSDDDNVKGRIAPPMFYRFSSSESTTTPPLKTEDVSLNPDHLACKLAEDALASYERDVGFGFAIYPDIDRSPRRIAYPSELSSDPREQARRMVRLAALKRWIQLVKEEQEECPPPLDSDDSLSSSLTDSTCTKPRSPVPINRSLSSLDSENSGDFFAMPATPVSKASYTNVLLKDVSPSSSVTDESPVATPSKQLSPFASSFVPSNAEAPGLSSFTFPTLNPPNKSTARLTTVKIKKDDQGFFTDVQLAEDTGPKSPLPSFLQQPSPRRRTRISKTREMVDRLRADNLTAKCISLSPSPDAHCDLRPSIQRRLTVSEDGGDRDRESSLSTPSQDDEDEGWMYIGIKAPGPSPSPSPSKAKRARDMLLALTRRMTTESASSEPCSTRDDSPAYAITRPASTDYAAPNHEGWIEGLPTSESPQPTPPRSSSTKPIPSITTTRPPPPPRKKQHYPTKSSSTTSSNVPSLLPSPTHASFPTGPSPYMAPIPMLSPPPAQFAFSVAPSPPVPVPAIPFFFAPVPPPPLGYPIPMHPHPHSLPQVGPYSPPGAVFMQSPFVPVPMHPMSGYAAAVTSARPSLPVPGQMGGMYQSAGMWNQGLKTQTWSTFGKA